jgi:hypothetical protein
MLHHVFVDTDSVSEELTASISTAWCNIPEEAIFVLVAMRTSVPLIQRLLQATEYKVSIFQQV